MHHLENFLLTKSYNPYLDTYAPDWRIIGFPDFCLGYHFPHVLSNKPEPTVTSKIKKKPMTYSAAGLYKQGAILKVYSENSLMADISSIYRCKPMRLIGSILG